MQYEFYTNLKWVGISLYILIEITRISLKISIFFLDCTHKMIYQYVLLITKSSIKSFIPINLLEICTVRKWYFANTYCSSCGVFSFLKIAIRASMCVEVLYYIIWAFKSWETYFIMLFLCVIKRLLHTKDERDRM